MKELIANILGLVRVFHFTKEETFNRETINEKISTAITNLSNTVDYKLANKSDNTHKHQKSDITNLVNADSKHDGLMISSDKVKLDNIEAGANKIIIDDALNKNSHNPVENAAIVSNIYNKTEITDLLANIDVGHGKLLSINVTEDGILQVDADSFEYYTTDEVDAELAKKTVSFEKQNVADEGFFSTYVLKQNGVQVGPKMNIPKDMLPISGSVKTVTTPNTPVQGYKVGDKYLDIVLNTIDGTGNDNHLYILATDFVDDYGADNITLQLVNRTFSIKDKGVSKAKLADNVQTSLGYADTFNSSPCKNITSDNIADWNNKAETDDIPVNVSELANDAGYITQHQDISGKVNVSDIKDNLASTDANKPLSAKQGKALNDKFSNYATKESVDNIIYGHADLAGYVKDNDARLSDSRTPKNHTHGNLSNDGKIGSTANLPVITGTGGVLQASSFGTGANTFCQGNDSRLNDSRVPKFAVITANESSIKDLNNYTAGGFYYCSDDAYSKYIIHCPNSNGTNTPYGGNRSFFLLVETWGVSSSNYLKQTLTYYNDNKTYTRTCNSGTWSSWKEISADTTYSPATTSTNGLMSSADKTKLDGIDNGANKITVDHELSSSSTNPIQNKVINAELSNKLDKSSSDTGFVKSNGSIVGFGTTGTTVAKGDHTHPTDTSRVAVAQGSGSANKSLCTDGNGNVTVEAKNNHTHSYVATSQGTGNSGKFLKVNSSGNVICESVTVPSEISVDSSLSSSSTNPVQNKVINTALSGKANSSHSHGNLSNDGKIGSTANLPVITGTNGVLQASSFGTGANTFCQGNDSRLSNARTPTSHTHGAIQNGGTLNSDTTTVGKVVVTDGSNNIKTISKLPSANVTHQDISGKENTSNKVTSINSSSTDTQYPSAKAVYNYAQAKYDYTNLKGTDNTSGYINLIKITISGAYQDKPIVIKTQHRDKIERSVVQIKFSNINNNDPSLQSITHTGQDMEFYLYKESTSNWILACGKGHAGKYDDVYIKIDNPNSNITTSKLGTHLATLPTSNIQQSAYIGFTGAEKTKLSGIATQANKTIITNNLTTTTTGTALDASQGTWLYNNKLSNANGSVTSNHIADKTIVNGDIADTTIETGKIKDSAITSAKIADGTIVNGDIANTTITGGKLVNGTITGTQLADNSVTSAKIVNGTITNDDIANQTIGMEKLAIHGYGGTSGTAGYVKLLRFTITDAYQDRPITFKIERRHANEFVNCTFTFKGASNTDPDLGTFVCSDEIGFSDNQWNAEVYLYKEDTSTWSLIVRKSENYDYVQLREILNPNSKITVTKIQEFITTLPTASTTNPLREIVCLNAMSEYIEGTHGTTATNVWTGTATKLARLTKGTTIFFKMTSAGTSTGATLNLTLANGSTTGAKSVYYNATTAFTTHLPVNSVLHLVYDGSKWINTAIQNTNNIDRIYAVSQVVNGESTQIPAYTLICGKTDKKYYKVASGVVLNTRYPILWLGGATNSGASTNNVYILYSGVNLQNTVSGKTITTNQSVYIEGTAYANGDFTVSSNVFVSEGSLTSGRYYLPIGFSYSTTNIRFNATNQSVYYYDGTNLKPVEEYKFATSGHTHGSIANNGQLNSDITSVNKVAVTDSSNNLKTISQLPYSKISGTPTIPTKTSQLTNDSNFTTATGHTHSYLPLSGGTVTGATTFNDKISFSQLKQGSANTDQYNVPWAGNFTWNTDWLTTLKERKSLIGSVSTGSGGLWSAISVRHRNGAGDGNSWGMYIKAPLTTAGNLIWQQDLNGTATTEKTILDSSNYSTYANKTTIVNNLTDGGTGSALSAEQGKNLQNNKVDKAQGSGNANKTLSTDANGNVIVEAKNNHTHNYLPSNADGTTTGNITATTSGKGIITANQFKKNGGTSSQFLKADGSVDSNTYLTTSSASSTYQPKGNYLTSHQDISGKENTSNKVTSISSSSTDAQYPSAKAVYNGLSGKSSTGHKHTGWTAISDVITGGSLHVNDDIKMATFRFGNTGLNFPRANTTYWLTKSGVTSTTGNSIIPDDYCPVTSIILSAYSTTLFGSVDASGIINVQSSTADSSKGVQLYGVWHF